MLRTLLGGFALLVASGISTADVRVELSSDSIGQDETVQLRLTADGARLQPPDLTVLDADFTIVDRRVQRSQSTINGQRRERIGLTLTLLPKRSGSLEIPAISLGTESTRPLGLTVVMSMAPDGSTATEAGNTAVPLSGGALPSSEPYPTPWQPYGPPPPYANPIQLAPGMLDLPLNPSPPEPADLRKSKDDDSHPTASARPATPGGTLQNPWFWIALVLALGLIVSLFRRPRNQVPRPVEIGTSAPALVERPPIEPPALAAIRVAYESGNAAAARDALLAWGRQAFPQDPPANLVRLAMRCDGPAREQITLLEQASYSPTPLEWNAAPVWEWLQRGHPAAVD